MYKCDVIIKHEYRNKVFEYLYKNHIPFQILGYMDVGVSICIWCVPSTADRICKHWKDAIVIPEVAL